MSPGLLPPPLPPPPPRVGGARLEAVSASRAAALGGALGGGVRLGLRHLQALLAAGAWEARCGVGAGGGWGGVGVAAGRLPRQVCGAHGGWVFPRPVHLWLARIRGASLRDLEVPELTVAASFPSFLCVVQRSQEAKEEGEQQVGEEASPR